MPITIRILSGEEPREDAVFDQKTVLIGREAGQDFRLESPSVSRRHCVVAQREGRWEVVDEHSRHGISVNGRPSVERQTLRHGDVIAIGEVLLKVGIGRPIDPARWLADLRETYSPGALSLAGAIAAGAITILALAVAFLSYLGHLRSLDAEVPADLSLVRETPAFGGARTIIFNVLDDGLGDDGLTVHDNLQLWVDLGVCSTNRAEYAPRLFNGRDLVINSGQRILIDGYLFHQDRFHAEDATDPYGIVRTEIEAWSGLGRRFGPKDLPAVRSPALPSEFDPFPAKPLSFERVEHGRFDGVERFGFEWIEGVRALDNPLPDPNFAWLFGMMVDRPASAQARMEGLTYVFFHDGCRYAATVRGSSGLLNRFESGLEGLGSKFLKGIAIDSEDNRPPNDRGDLDQQISEQFTGLMMGFGAESELLRAGLRHEDLAQARAVLVLAQRFADPLPREPALRDLYFDLRDRAQAELRARADLITPGLDKCQDEVRGMDAGVAPLADRVEALREINEFLGGVADKGVATEGPEWERYVREVRRMEPYGKYFSGGGGA